MSRMKCTVCRATADFKTESHNLKLCSACFRDWFLRQVKKAIDEWQMFTPRHRILVAASGGKDSLGLWLALKELGYPTHGVHLDLGLGEASARSLEACRNFAEDNDLHLLVFSVREAIGAGVEELRAGTTKPTCAVCGVVKRYLLNEVARVGGYGCLVTGHNLDDETAKLLGNVLRWRDHHLRHQRPLLEARDGLVRRAKPFYRMDQEEIRFWNKLSEIRSVAGACPYARGATLPFLQDAMERLEATMPGTKRYFLFRFLERGRQSVVDDGEQPVEFCRECGLPGAGGHCVFCRLLGDVWARPDVDAWWQRQMSSPS